MSALTEEVGTDSPDTPRSPTVLETSQAGVGESLSRHQPEIGPDTNSTTVQKSWFRRTIIARYLSTLMPGLDDLLADEPAPIDDAPGVLTNDPEETKENGDPECVLDLSEVSYLNLQFLLGFNKPPYSSSGFLSPFCSLLPGRQRFFDGTFRIGSFTIPSLGVVPRLA